MCHRPVCGSHDAGGISGRTGFWVLGAAGDVLRRADWSGSRSRVFTEFWAELDGNREGPQGGCASHPQAWQDGDRGRPAGPPGREAGVPQGGLAHAVPGL